MNLTHQFLLAMPHMQDPHFRQALVYILNHNEEGAWGVVINKTADLTLFDVFQQLEIQAQQPCHETQCVHIGGPVSPEQGLVLHTPAANFETTQHFDSGVSVTSSLDVLAALAAGEEPQLHRVLLGHAGWGAGQLEQEVLDNAWLTCEANLDILFSTQTDNMLKAAAAIIGIDMHSIVADVGHA